MDNLNTEVMVAVELHQESGAVFELGELANAICGSCLGEIIIG